MPYFYSTEHTSRRLSDANAIAFLAHDGQFYNGKPYITHPMRVVLLLVDRGIGDEDHLIVAWLHDVVEDTPVTLSEIRDKFGDQVADAVDAISRRKGDNWKEDEDSYLRRVAANPIATEVKFADMLDNLSMTRHPDCPEDKKKLWKKYVNALRVLSELTMNTEDAGSVSAEKKSILTGVGYIVRSAGYLGWWVYNPRGDIIGGTHRTEAEAWKTCWEDYLLS